MLKRDITMSDKDKHHIICTDFGATLDLHASEKHNCSVYNHAVICIMLVACDWRNIKYMNRKGKWVETIVNTHDKWLILGDTLSHGKKNDHIFHNSCLTYII
eukprot:10428089-Ditylum_brightwellii.AAC.2